MIEHCYHERGVSALVGLVARKQLCKANVKIGWVEGIYGGCQCDGGTTPGRSEHPVYRSLVDELLRHVSYGRLYGARDLAYVARHEQAGVSFLLAGYSLVGEEPNDGVPESRVREADVQQSEVSSAIDTASCERSADGLRDGIVEVIRDASYLLLGEMCWQMTRAAQGEERGRVAFRDVGE
jgi:hypothetical protein